MLQYSPALQARHEALSAAVSPGNGSKGTWVSAGTTSFDWQWVTVSLINSIGSAANAIVDIGVDDGAGNRFVLVPDVFVYLKLANFAGFALSMPLRVPRGAALYARGQASAASTLITVTLTGSSVGFGGAPGFSRAVALYTPASSAGVLVDSGASANTYGSYVVLTSSAPAAIGAVVGTIGSSNDTARAANTFNVDLGIGAAGAERPLGAEQPYANESGSDMLMPLTFGPYPCRIASGSAVSVRSKSTSSTAGDRAFLFGLLGLVI